jgi:hypothetical protein
MRTEEIVAGLLDRLPEDVSVYEAAREIEFIAAVREGFESYEREGGVSTEEARARVSCMEYKTSASQRLRGGNSRRK